MVRKIQFSGMLWWRFPSNRNSNPLERPIKNPTFHLWPNNYKSSPTSVQIIDQFPNEYCRTWLNGMKKRNELKLHKTIASGWTSTKKIFRIYDRHLFDSSLEQRWLMIEFQILKLLVQISTKNENNKNLASHNKQSCF
jgi:hypothetical protein